MGRETEPERHTGLGKDGRFKSPEEFRKEARIEDRKGFIAFVAFFTTLVGSSLNSDAYNINNISIAIPLALLMLAVSYWEYHKSEKSEKRALSIEEYHRRNSGIFE